MAALRGTPCLAPPVSLTLTLTLTLTLILTLTLTRTSNRTRTRIRTLALALTLPPSRQSHAVDRAALLAMSESARLKAALTL